MNFRERTGRQERGRIQTTQHLFQFGSLETGTHTDIKGEIRAGAASRELLSYFKTKFKLFYLLRRLLSIPFSK